jgi:hypothetical protein
LKDEKKQTIVSSGWLDMVIGFLSFLSVVYSVKYILKRAGQTIIYNGIRKTSVTLPHFVYLQEKSGYPVKKNFLIYIKI